VWNRDAREIVGAYRMGQTDTIVARDGVGGLYTRALFRYDARLLRQVGGPVLELGRSFVREEYQKNYSALLLLWRGIGEFLVRHPRYRHLLGPVSISARHSNRSRETLMAFLERKHFDPALARLVAPTNPPVRDAGTPHSIEPDRSNIPVLLRHYLKLNARAIGFNVDAAFGDALDALMIVDLARVESAVLARYLGRDSLVRAA